MSFSEPTLRITDAQFNMIVAHCYDGLPNEACGLLSGPMRDGKVLGVVTEAWPCRNEAESAVIYTVDGRDFLKASRAAEARDEEIIGVWHSHTHTDPYPSPTDIRQAVDPAWIYVIVSLRDNAPMLRAYRIVGGEVAEVQVARSGR